jgi:LacI family transcriptional regulator
MQSAERQVYMSSIKEIAKQVGISPASVSIYLSNKETNRVSAKTKALIDRAVTELNYHKNVFASSLSTHESKLIGVIIPTILPLFQNDYTNALLSGLQTRLSSFGYGLLFFPSSAQSSIAIVKEQLEKSAGCDGYVLFSTGFCTHEQIHRNIEEVGKTGKPFVTLNIPKVDEDVSQVLIDDLAQPSGARYLIDCGHTELLLVLGRQGGEHTRALQRNYKRLLQEYGIPYSPERVLYGEYSEETSYTLITNALEAMPRITGICCMSDIMAASAIRAAAATGRAVPRDISIIGRNDSIHARLSLPALTTIDLHMQQAGSGAANVLLDALDGSTASQKILLSGSLVERDSVRSLL